MLWHTSMLRNNGDNIWAGDARSSVLRPGNNVLKHSVIRVMSPGSRATLEINLLTPDSSVGCHH
jgi:hypothetical protein